MDRPEVEIMLGNLPPSPSPSSSSGRFRAIIENALNIAYDAGYRRGAVEGARAAIELAKLTQATEEEDA